MEPTGSTTQQANGSQHVCPWQRVSKIDNWLRPLIHNPNKLLGPHVKPGMTAMDVGCGGGFNSMALARLVGEGGHVIAVDLQAEMLEIVAARATREGLAGRVETRKCEANSLGVEAELDFAVAFFMLHEVPDQRGFYREVHGLLRPGGRLLVAEPMFHVSRQAFESSVALAQDLGLRVVGRPRVLGGRGVVLDKELVSEGA